MPPLIVNLGISIGDHGWFFFVLDSSTTLKSIAYRVLIDLKDYLNEEYKIWYDFPYNSILNLIDIYGINLLTLNWVR